MVSIQRPHIEIYSVDIQFHIDLLHKYEHEASEGDLPSYGVDLIIIAVSHSLIVLSDIIVRKVYERVVEHGPVAPKL